MKRALGLPYTFLAIRISALLLASATLASCASYSPLPLDPTSRLKDSVADLRHLSPDGKSIDINSDAGLTIEDVALLAVENNPELRAARDERGIAKAEVLEAGLLPNPQISGSYGFLLSGPATFDSWTVGLSQDLKSLVTLSANKTGAHYQAMKVDANLLWEEWQVIGKARLLYIDVVQGEKQQQLLEENRKLFAERYAEDRKALDEGNLVLTQTAPDLSALSDVEKQINDLDRQQRAKRVDLNALLGLSPNVALKLSDSLNLPKIDPATANRLLTDLAERRPDLIALKLGYESQEESVRAAILSQFPILNFGGSWGADTSNVRSAGPQVTLELPIFNHNQGKIALARATRRQLHDEFSNRVAAAVGDAQASLKEQAALERQLKQEKAELEQADTVARHAETAYRNGMLDERTYIDLVMTRIGKMQEIATLQQALFEQQAAIATLMGIGMPEIGSSKASRGGKS